MRTMNNLQEIIQNPKKAVKFILYKVLTVMGHSDYRRFIVLSRSRTGSNMLISLLNSSSNVRAEGELFGMLNGRNYKDVLTAAYGKQPYYIKAKGFKIFYYHPLDDENSNIWNDLVNMEDLYVIHLKRRNILRTLISRKIAEVSNGWLKTDSGSRNSVRPKQVSFTEKELTDGFEQTRCWEQKGDDMFQNHKMISVYYEDIVSDTEYNFRNITDFLDVQYVQPQTNLKRQNPERICELVSNFEELKTAFRGTKWHSFFEE